MLARLPSRRIEYTYRVASANLPAAETVTLKDGTAVTLRPIRPDDAPRLQAFHTRLSPQTIYLRWLAAHPVLTDTEAASLSNLDYTSRMAFVATRPAADGAEHIIGVSRYAVAAPERPDEVEAAIVVEDAYQGRGLGTHLLRRLWAYARAQGIRYWVAEINAENAPMMKFIQRGTLPTTRRFEGGSWQVKIDIAPPP
jgi:GNAT superfamily N-acetyltransferase